MLLTKLIRKHQANGEHDDRYKNFDPENFDYTVKAKLPSGATQVFRNPKEEEGSLIDKKHQVPEGTELLIVGTAFWSWRAETMETVGIDIDTDHTHKGGLKAEVFENVCEQLANVPWLKTLRSTGGEGLHAFPEFAEPISASSRAECSTLAQAVLTHMERLTGFDFNSAKDCAGSNFWIFSKNADPRAYQVVQAATEKLNPKELPAGWREARRVTTHKVEYTPATVELEQDHLKIEKEIAAFGHSIVWVDAHKCYQVHTKGLELASEEHNYRGLFVTDSDGSDPGKPNAYMFPLPGGGFLVKRFGDAKEHDSWFEGGNGQYAYLNVEVPIRQAAEHFSDADSPKGYAFSCGTVLTNCLKSAGIDFECPEALAKRSIYLKIKNRDLQLTSEKIDSEDSIQGWVAGKGTWTKTIKCSSAPNAHKQADQLRVSNLVRAVSTDAESAKWCINTNGLWRFTPAAEVRNVMRTELVVDNRVSLAMGEMRKYPFTIVHEPFKDEYLSGRRWNRDAPQFACSPAVLDEETPTWDAVFEHIGSGLDDAIANCADCHKLGITSGSHYLKLWTSLLLTKPEQRTPYLFLTSRKNNTGKSSFGFSMTYLISPGVGEISAEALAGMFTSELEGKVLCLIEELDLRNKRNTAYTKLKTILTSKTLNIRCMRTDAYSIPNFTHFIHTANDARFVPCEFEDTRIVMIDVPELANPIESIDFEKGIADEAPSMLRKLIDMPLTEPCGRFWLPVVSTSLKEDVLSGVYGEESSSELEGVLEFARERLVKKPRDATPTHKILSAYRDYCGPQSDNEETRFPTVHFNGFLKLLREHWHPTVGRKQKRVKGKQVWHYTGVALKA